jgi:pilus assembly protein CpaB
MQAETVTRTVLQNVGVLSAGQTIQTDGKSQSIQVPVVTLLVSPHDAEALTLANSDGHVQLVLRNSADEKAVATTGSRLRDLYGGLPPVETIAETAPQPARPRAGVVAVSQPAVRPPPRVTVAPRPAGDEMEVIQGKVKTIEILSRGSDSK